jgi:hypothetical protein
MPKIRQVRVIINHPSRTTSTVRTMPRYEAPIYQRAMTAVVSGAKNAGGSPTIEIVQIKPNELSPADIIDLQPADTIASQLRAQYGHEQFSAVYPDGTFEAELKAIAERDAVDASMVIAAPEADEFRAIPSLTPRAIEQLIKAGITSLAGLANAAPEVLQSAIGCSLSAGSKLRRDAEQALEAANIPVGVDN